MRPGTLVLAALFAGLAGAATAQQPTPTSCVACHGSEDLFGEEGPALLARFERDVHAAVGLSCQHCHGGNPDPGLGEDMDRAMDPGFGENPYVGAPARGSAPASCGRCHSDPVFMKRYKPDARVDQEQEYWTSQHGRSLARGDTAVATCVDCHGAHGVLPVENPSSPVYPTRVAETCRSCHADSERMSERTTPDGRPLPIDQFARWQRSVHAQALVERGDLSAPTCNDCHGNHGATPPGLDSIAFVCGQCHGREAELFRASSKRLGFEEHNAYLADAGADGCAACHGSPEPQAALAGVHSFTECTSCHGNHAIVRPTLAMLAPLPELPCAFCHEGTGPLAAEFPEPPAQQRHYQEVRDGLLAEARAAGLSGQQLFDWLVDRAASLPAHTLAGEAGAEPGPTEPRPPELRPEFSRLFAKFRIGKSTFTYADPVTGSEVEEAVVRCSDCHAPEPQLTDAAVGLTTAQAFVRRIQELTSATARAERILLAARRGGVETRPALSELEQAVDAQIELEVLVHAFSAAEDGAFLRKFQDGAEHAAAALRLSRGALEELAFRRRGLAVSLVFVVLLLVGLGLKIRQLSHPAATAGAPEPPGSV